MESRFGIYRRLLGYLRPYWIYVVIAYAAMVAATLINLFIPQIIKQAIDSGLDEGRALPLFIAAGLILAIALVRGVVAFAQRYYGEWLTHRVAYDLRNDFYLAVQHLPFAFHDSAQTGDLMSRRDKRYNRDRAFRRDRHAGFDRHPAASVRRNWRHADGGCGADAACSWPARRSGRLGALLRQHRSTDVQAHPGADGRTVGDDAGEYDRHRRGEGVCTRRVRAGEVRRSKRRMVRSALCSHPAVGKLLADLHAGAVSSRGAAALVRRAAGDRRHDYGRHAIRHDLLCADAERTRLADRFPCQPCGHGRCLCEPRVRDHRHAQRCA